MKSCIGQNVQFLCERYTVCRLDICQNNPSSFSALVSKFNEVHIDQHLHMWTQCVFQLLMVRNSLWYLSDVHFTRSDVYGAITFLRTYWMCFLLFYDLIFFLFSVLRVLGLHLAHWLGRRSLVGGLALICGWHVTTSWVRCPLWVNHPGQLSLPSLQVR